MKLSFLRGKSSNIPIFNPHTKENARHYGTHNNWKKHSNFHAHVNIIMHGPIWATITEENVCLDVIMGGGSYLSSGKALA